MASKKDKGKTDSKALGLTPSILGLKTVRGALAAKFSRAMIRT
jgi:hypothetical protein